MPVRHNARLWGTASGSPEARARGNIDKPLIESGWIVQSPDEATGTADGDAATRQFPLKSGYGEANYFLYFDGAPSGVVEVKKDGNTLTSHEIQTEKSSG